MTKPLVITVVTRGDDIIQHVPIGFQIADQMYEEAGLQDSVSAGQHDGLGKHLGRLRRALYREFGGRVKLYVINLWTLEGLWYAFRHRLREFPCLVIAGRRYAPDTPPETLIEILRQHV